VQFPAGGFALEPAVRLERYLQSVKLNGLQAKERRQGHHHAP